MKSVAKRKQVKKLSTELSVRAWAFYRERLDGLKGDMARYEFRSRILQHLAATCPEKFIEAVDRAEVERG